MDNKNKLNLTGNDAINMMYMFAQFRPKRFGVYQVYAREEQDEMIAHFEHQLVEAAEQADAEHVTRLAQALYVMKTAEYENIWWRVENRVNQLVEENKLEAYHLVNIVRAFSRAQQNKMVGSEKTFVHLEPFIAKLLHKMSARDISHVMYAYGVRGAGNPKFHEQLLKAMKPKVKELDYPGLHNLVYYLMFKDCTDEAIWKDVIDTTVENEETLPLIYYKPFKASFYFMKHHFPHLDENREPMGTPLSFYQDKFFHAEKYFNVVKLDDEYHKNNEYVDFRAFLTGHCNVYPTPFVTVHNLFNLHYVFYQHKIGIQFHLKKHLKPDGQTSEMQKLASKIMKFEGWEIMNLSEAEFKEWTYEERMDNIKGWLREAKVRQVEKGVLPKEPPRYV